VCEAGWKRCGDVDSYVAAKNEQSRIPTLGKNNKRYREPVELVKDSVEEHRVVYVLVYNRSERNALLMIQAVGNARYLFRFGLSKSTI
jgi:hypothetical protein